MKFWTQVDGDPVECTMEEWSAYMARNIDGRTIGKAEAIVDGHQILVSSVFIGYGDMPYETMCFFNGESVAEVRAATGPEAADHFMEAVQQLEAKFGVKMTARAARITDDASVAPPMLTLQDNNKD